MAACAPPTARPTGIAHLATVPSIADIYIKNKASKKKKKKKWGHNS
jgi:hypothetical protein